MRTSESEASHKNHTTGGVVRYILLEAPGARIALWNLALKVGDAEGGGIAVAVAWGVRTVPQRIAKCLCVFKVGFVCYQPGHVKVCICVNACMYVCTCVGDWMTG